MSDSVSTHHNKTRTTPSMVGRLCILLNAKPLQPTSTHFSFVVFAHQSLQQHFAFTVIIKEIHNVIENRTQSLN